MPGRGRDQAGVEEREADPVARRVDDRVDLLDAPVGEAHPVALELGHVGLGHGVARAQPEQDLAGHGRVGLQEVVVGGGQAEVLHPARDQPRNEPGEPPLEPQG